MLSEPGAGNVVAVSNLTEFFRDALRSELASQHLEVDQQTEHYVVNLLTLFARAERLYESTPDGMRLKTLAEMLDDAVQAPSAAERNLALQRLGDVSLFMAGFFSRGFARRLVDVDYHIAMGGNAYSLLANATVHDRRRGVAWVFGELAAKFQPLVDALGAISDAAYVHTQRDVLRLYEIWLKTGSTRARALLRRLGVEAAPVALRPQ